MAVLQWDLPGSRKYETGVEKCVLYPQAAAGDYPLGVAWNGITNFTESPSGAEATPLYADNIKYLNLISAEEFGATIEAFMYPDEFGPCNGEVELSPGVIVGQQTRTSFGLVHKTILGNDILEAAYGYKLHLIYGCKAAPSEKAYPTINDSPEANNFSWEVSTTPVAVSGLKPTSQLTIISTDVDASALASLEAILYGTAETDPRLPLPDEVAALFAAGAPSAIALSTIVPEDDDTDIAADANIVLTFNNKILREYITIMKADGTMVLGARSWDTTGKILTFNPTSNLTAGATYIVTIAGVCDIYNQVLATAVKNFTVVDS